MPECFPVLSGVLCLPDIRMDEHGDRICKMAHAAHLLSIVDVHGVTVGDMSTVLIN